MKIGVLTSSRADYGIYQPLLKLLSENKGVDLHIIVFGMHLLDKYGRTIDIISSDGFGEIHIVNGLKEGDQLIEVGESYGHLIHEFSHFWNQNKFDKVLALGDRFEMSAAVQASIPFEVFIAHLHGGETTLGAVDNIYRHQISLVAKQHFVCTSVFAERVSQITQSTHNIHNVGALSLDNIEDIELPTWEEVCTSFHIPNYPFVLITFHPETVGINENKAFAQQCFDALSKIQEREHLVITMANADPMGSLYRDMAQRLRRAFPERVTLVENFGKMNYFSAMKNCSLMLGNTSSGILEAASFGKYVINVGDRQRGRLRNENVLDVPFLKDDIVEAYSLAKKRKEFTGENYYYKANTGVEIMDKILYA